MLQNSDGMAGLSQLEHLGVDGGSPCKRTRTGVTSTATVSTMYGLGIFLADKDADEMLCVYLFEF